MDYVCNLTPHLLSDLHFHAQTRYHPPMQHLSLPESFLPYREESRTCSWAGCVLALCWGADSTTGCPVKPGNLLQYDSYLCTCPLFPRKVGGFSSHLYPSPAHAGLVPSRTKSTQQVRGGLRSGISGDVEENYDYFGAEMLRHWKPYTCYKLCTLCSWGIHLVWTILFEDAYHTLSEGIG